VPVLRSWIVAAALVLAPARALAQNPNAPSVGWSWLWWALVLAAIVVVVTGALVAVGGRYFEAQDRRESESTRLLAQLTAPLRRNPRLAGLSVLPVVTIAADGDATVELTGEVPSAELHDEVLTVVEHTLDRHRPGTHIVDNLRVHRVA
jgi:hypothetical protein